MPFSAIQAKKCSLQSKKPVINMSAMNSIKWSNWWWGQLSSLYTEHVVGIYWWWNNVSLKTWSHFQQGLACLQTLCCLPRDRVLSSDCPKKVLVFKSALSSRDFFLWVLVEQDLESTVKADFTAAGWTWREMWRELEPLAYFWHNVMKLTA